jgi:hypothetical protein
MLLKPGDKVSFLNEKRDGVVIKILNNKMVLVEIEDGFNIPVLEHDLVKVQTYDDRLTNNEISPQTSTVSSIKSNEAAERFAQRKNLINITDEKDKINRGLYIAFVPEYPDNVLSSGIGIYLLNHNSHDILFTYSLKENDHYVCKDFDNVYEESSILLDVIDITDIEKWKDIKFQFLFFKQGSAINKPPVEREIHVKPVRFYKEDKYILHPFLNEKCFLISLSEKEQKQPEEWTEEKWENRKIEKPAGVKVVGHIKDYFNLEPFPVKHIIEKGIAEVDLHIEELTEKYAGMENFELLNIQLNYFAKMLESAIANQFRMVTFIHGVGNGRLKQEIINKLLKDYPSLQYRDAPPGRYGFGATEVLIEA